MPARPQRSGSSPKRTAYARIEVSTARACLRRLSPLVNSVRSTQPWSRVTGSGAQRVLAPPLVDGLLREHEAAILLHARDAALGGQGTQRRLVDAEVLRGLAQVQHVL